MRELSRQGDLAVVGSYRFSHEAELARAALETAGIRAWVLDAVQIRMRWYMSDALGGIKVAVRNEDAADARALLERDFSVELRNVPESYLPPAPEEICPVCGSDKFLKIRSPKAPSGIRERLLSLMAFLLGTSLRPDRFATARQCAACGHRSG